MAEARRGIVLRVTPENFEVTKQALRALGSDGELALKQLERSADGVTPRLKAMDEAGKLAGQSIRGEFSRLSTGLVGLISPVNLLIAGAGTLVGTFISSFQRIEEEVVSTDELISAHAETIGLIEKAYKAAQEGATEYFGESTSVLNALLTAQTLQLRDRLAETRETLREEMVVAGGLIDGRLTPVFDQVLRLGSDSASSIRQLREEVAELVAAWPDDEGLVRAAGLYFEITQEAYDTEEQILATNDALRRSGEIASGAASGLGQYADALATLQNLAAVPQSDWAIAGNALNQALTSTTDPRALMAALAEYRAAADRIKEAEANRAGGGRSGGAGNSEEDRLESLARTIVNEVNPALGARLDLEERLGDLTALQNAGLIDQETYLLAVASAQSDYNDVLNAVPIERLERWKNGTLSFLEDLRNELKEQPTLWGAFAEAALNALDRIAGNLLSNGVDRIFNALGSVEGGIGDGAILNAIAGAFAGGNATGGQIPMGKWGTVGERGIEAVYSGPGGALVLPASATGPTPPRGRQGDMISINVTINGARGNGEIEAFTYKAINRALEEHDKALTRAQLTYG